jgi:hypothetical protein
LIYLLSCFVLPGIKATGLSFFDDSANIDILYKIINFQLFKNESVRVDVP